MPVRDEPPISAAREWATGWPLVLSCMLGVSVIGAAPYAIGQFMVPLEQAFGWSRTQTTAGLSVGILFGFVLAPVVGRLVDRINARLLVLPGLVLTGLAIAALSLATRSTGLWIALWSMLTAVGTLIGPTVWVTVIAGTFKAGRSLAMALALAGTALSSTIAPFAARSLIDATDWRTAWQLLAAAWCGITLLVALPCFVDRRPREPRHPDATAPPGTPIRLLVRSSIVLRLALVTLAAMTIVSACMIHLSPALVDKGFTPRTAAEIAGLAGVMVSVGKLHVGLLFDRWPMRASGLSVMAMLALACVLLAVLRQPSPGAIVAVAALGIASGALLALIACITARMFPPGDFGTVFGLMISMVTLAGGIGPILASSVHDRLGSYQPIFWGGVFVAAGCGLLLATLSGPAPRRVPQAATA